MAVDLQSNVSVFFTGLHQTFQVEFSRQTTYWEKVAMRVDSSTEIESYAWLDRIPRMRQWLGPRVKHNASTRVRNITNGDFELTQAVPRNKLNDDKLGIYGPLTAMMAQQAAKYPDIAIANLMQANPTAYDNIAFFGTHLSNPDDTATTPTTYNNSLTLSLTPGNFGAARAAMRGWVGADLNPFGINPTLLVVPPQLEDVARRILMTDYVGRGNITPATGVIPTDSAVTATAENNIYKGAADLLVIPELQNQPTTWYLLDNSTALKPFLVQVRQEPQFVYLNDMRMNDNLFWNKEYVYGVDARWGFDVTMPFLALRSVG